MDLIQAIQQAATHANQGKFAEADKLCRDIIAANDRFHPAFHLLGQLAAHAGRDDVAVPMLKRAAALNPDNAQYHRDLAEVLLFSANAQEALSCIERAVNLEPENSKAHFTLGLITMTLGQVDRAIEAYQSAIKLEPNFGPAHNNLGSLLETSGDLQGAKNEYAEAIRIDHKNAQAQNNLASILIGEGNIEKAKSHLEAAIEAAPDYIEAHHNLSGLKKYSANDKHMELLLELAKDTSRLTKENQIRLEFVLAKAYADIKEYDQAFIHYDTGNKLKRSTFEYNEHAAKQFHIKLKESFPSALFQGREEAVTSSPTPIFIVGMPRSGSTLVEQILTSHDDISTAGELKVLNEIIKEHIPDFPGGMDNVTNDVFKKIGDAYIAVLQKAGPDSRYKIDKMPGNYRLIGMIAKAMPHAKIIHTIRNPMDCCVSIYTRLFLNILHYGYDLVELANYYNMYQDLMNHWHNVLPKGAIFDVAYKDVVSDLKAVSKDMIQYLGLEWEPALLEFYNQKSNVTTASAAQVRTPIYTSSVNRWRVYEKHLGVLIETLNEADVQLK